MSLDPELQRVYASAPAGQRLIEGVSLSHPGFSRTFHLTTERTGFTANDGSGGVIVYEPGPVAVTPPGQDASGRGEMPIRIGVTQEVVQELNAAASRANEPLTLVVRTYLHGETTPREIKSLELTGVETDPAAGVISAVATLPDLEGMGVPRLSYRVDRWPGLDRA